MPAGAARPPGCLPGGLARLGGLPEREVARVALAALVDILGGPHVLQALAGQLAVMLIGADVEVDAAARGVGVAGADQPPHQLDHLRHVPGRPGLGVRRQAAEGVVRAGERALVALGYGPPRNALGAGGPEDLVVDVGHVPDERHLVPARGQPPDQDVEVDAGPDVADVRGCLNGRPAQVHRRPPRRERGERAYLARCSVVEADRHGARLPGRPPLAGLPSATRAAQQNGSGAGPRHWPGSVASAVRSGT